MCDSFQRKDLTVSFQIDTKRMEEVRPMLSIDEFIIAVFCCIDDWWQEHYGGKRIRGGGFAPALRESEVMTMEVVAEFLGIDTDKGIWQYFRRHWQEWFPHLSSRSAFVRQAANLVQYKAQLQGDLATALDGFSDRLHLVDGVAIPVCGFKRAPRCVRLWEMADYGYCAAKDMTYYGVRGHLLVNGSGVIAHFGVSSPRTDEREAMLELELLEAITGLVLGDKGYLSAPLQAELRRYDIELQSLFRVNMSDERSPAWLRLLGRFRRRIETVIGQLSDRFHIERVWARDLWHFHSRINRKVLAHTICCWLNRQLGLPTLQFDALVA
jgi:hypothetical protein